jgi:hypothetical protein
MLRRLIDGFVLRPTVLVAALLCLANSSPSHAQNTQREEQITKQAFNNLSHETLICAAYYSIAAACLAKDARGADTAKRYEGYSELSIRRAVVFGKTAGVSDNATSARTSMALERLRSETENSCTNIAVQLRRYNADCQSLLENPKARLDALATEAITLAR